jgi:hypothetical protein
MQTGIGQLFIGTVMNKSLTISIFITLLLMPLSRSIAQTCSKQSSAHTVALLELYTSEGCSSCPPADKFVSNLHNTGVKADQVVPLSLHVDYWDYIGWKDKFANSIFTQRQRWLSALADTRTVYTPEIFIAAQEVRDWSAPQSIAAAIKRINDRPAQAEIKMTLGQAANRALPLEVNVKNARDGNLFVALYENGLSTQVAAGENQGATLKHDYVVRDWIGPVALGSNAAGRKVVLPRLLAIPGNAITKNLGVAAFIQTDKGEILQAVSIPVCGG